MRPLGFLISLFLAGPAVAQAPLSLQQRVEARLREAGPGTRFGLVVADSEGREIVAIAPTDRFIPASNTKMYTVAAALATLTGLDRPDIEGSTTVRLEGKRRPDVILTGYGDARLSSAPGCIVDCLSTLADAVAAKTKTVGNIIGDATWFPDQRWSAGMSWNNVSERSGTGVAALSLDSNELPLRIMPGAVGQPPVVEAGDYLAVENRAITVASGPTTLDVTRLPFERTVRLVGTIALGTPPEKIALGIDDPAHYAAWNFARMLKARGVSVRGALSSRYRAALPPETPLPPLPPTPEPLARVVPPPLDADLRAINKVSQNLHAELLLRRVGRGRGNGSVGDGLMAIEAMLTGAGIARAAYDFADGSGMSSYNRIAPRGTVAFLRWVAAQPWGAAFRATLPVGGVDGTIARRFVGTPLKGRIFAKTGGLNATNALSGFMLARSGRELVFSMIANDVPQGQRVIPTMDAVLEMIAAAN
jgi:serine-type D-Ala-D-Ala carboxypeptidase/endopeptidase (penicillin-binding protein 4)